MEEVPDGYQFLYLKGGKVRHLVPGLASPSSMVSARCGRGPSLFSAWFGTGSWDETQRLAVMSTCKRCRKLYEDDGIRSTNWLGYLALQNRGK
jgi:hypothetical protein